MHRAGCVGVVSKCTCQIRQLEWSGRERSHVRNTRIRNLTRQTRTAGNEIPVVLEWKAVFRRHRHVEVVILHIGTASGSAIERGGKLRICTLGGAQEKVVGRRIGGRFLFRQRKVRTWRSIGVHNPLGKKIIDRLAILRNIGGENVIEATVFTNDDDDMFDRRGGGVVAWWVSLRLVRSEGAANGELEDRRGYKSGSYSPQGCRCEMLCSHYFLPS